MTGLKHILAAACAIYKREEVAVMAGMELAALNTMIGPEAIKEARKAIPEAIKNLADDKVYKDLASGMVTKETEMADRISARRIKLAIDLHREGRETERDDEAIQKQRERDLKERFKVDRATGVEISTRREDEDNQSK